MGRVVGRIAQAHTAPKSLPLCASRLVDGFAHVQIFGKSGPIDPHKRVSQLKSRIFEGTHQPMMRPGTAKRYEMRTRLEHAKDGSGPLLGPSLKERPSIIGLDHVRLRALAG